MDNHIEKAFRKCELFSKQQIARAVKHSRDCLSENAKENRYTKRAQEIYQNYYTEFLSLVNNASLPTLTEKWWHYTFATDIDKIYVTLCNGSDLNIEDGMVSSMTIEFDEVLLEARAKYIPIEEYSKLHDVSDRTVENWIQKGQLKSIVRNDKNQWLISELECRPVGMDIITEYKIPDNANINIPEFPLANVSKEIYIYKDPENPKSIECTFSNWENGLHIKMIIPKQKSEMLQYLLNACEDVKVISSGNALPICY